VSQLADALLSLPRAESLLTAISIRGLLGDFGSINPLEDAETIDWPDALLLASALTNDRSESAQEAALRIAQACLTEESSVAAHRAAAAIILERLGNRPAVRLATARNLVNEDSWLNASAPLTLDVIRSRLELSLAPAADGLDGANRFQSDLWRSLERNQVVSFSAPTSAGKSRLVREWVRNQLKSNERYRAVFLVPTRALIDEVSKELRALFPSEVGVAVLPWDTGIGQDKEVFVLTQERMHLLQQQAGVALPIDLLFVDEAQKFDDSSRGILLERVVAEVMRTNPDAQVLYASPFSENPGDLLDPGDIEGGQEALVSPTITVIQNLVWANQRPYKTQVWDLDLLIAGEPVRVGSVDLPVRPAPESKRLPLIALSLAGQSSGNIVYVNTPSAAETTARQIADALSEAESAHSGSVADLIELSNHTVHPQFALSEVLRRGVAFHYGNMPALLRVEIERLFRDGAIRYLVCTSTLLEGVNLPCRNLFVRGPRRGSGNPMTPPDFWNLAGRAGRWGMEFQGNIICVDTKKETQWPEPPRERVRYPISRASSRTTAQLAEFIEYLEAGAPSASQRGAPPFESLYSYLSGLRVRALSLRGAATANLSEDEVTNLEERVDASLEGIEIPAGLILRHAGISPRSIQRLLDDFRQEEDATTLIVSTAESDDAVDQMVRAIARVARNLGGSFGPPGGRHFMLALLVVHWMNGYPLARIIAERIAYRRRRNLEVRLPSLIRDCMSDVEQIARFEAPKFLACYIDVLKLHLGSLGLLEELPELPDIAMLLELGVNRTTELSLISLGLSRSSAVALSEFIVADDMTPADAALWLADRDLASYGLPALIEREISQVLQARSGTSVTDS
jgi:hypothetical protein